MGVPTSQFLKVWLLKWKKKKTKRKRKRKGNLKAESMEMNVKFEVDFLGKNDSYGFLVFNESSMNKPIKNHGRLFALFFIFKILFLPFFFHLGLDLTFYP